MRFLSTFVCCLSLFFLSIMPDTLAAKPTKVSTTVAEPTNVLFVGNSFFYYNNGIQKHFRSLISSAGLPLPEAKMATIGGSNLSAHDVEGYFKPNGVGAYTPAKDGTMHLVDPSKKIFNITVLQDGSGVPFHAGAAAMSADYIKKHCATIRKYQAEPVLFMAWGHQRNMTAEGVATIAEFYTNAGNANGILVIPAALAFDRAAKQRPEVALYQKDQRHPSMEGTYLAGCTLFASLYKKSPVGIKYDADLGQETATFLQTIAWETVQAYYAK